MSSKKIRKIGKLFCDKDQPRWKKFKNNHEPENKPAPATNKTKSNCVILNLTDCCFDHILQHLSIDDLKSLSRTCRRLYTVAGEYFQQNNANERLTVHSYQVKDQSKIELLPANKKVRNFHRFIRNIKLLPSTQLYGHEPIDLFVYLRFNCCQNLKKLVLCRINCFQTAERYGAFINGQLATLECIEFDACHIDDIHRAFLKYCQRINSLTIKLIDKFHWNALFNYGLTWTYQQYPNLKHIQLSYVGAHYLDIDAFFARNAQIESVTSTSLDVIKSVCHNNQMKLRQLTIQCVDEGFLERIGDKLIEYCERKCVERVNIGCVANPLKLSTKRITSLGILKEFQGFHFWFNRKNVLLMTSTLAAIEHLKMLSIHLLEDKVTLDVLETIAKHVPTLECLHFDSMLGPKPFAGYNFQQIIMPFVRNANLMEIAFHCPYFNRTFFQKTDLIDLIAVRGGIHNACAFNIYMESNVIHKIQFIVPVYSLITIKPVSTIDKCSCLSHSILYW